MELLLPFLKNLSILCLTSWLLLLGAAIKRVGLEGFSFAVWLRDNKARFIVGFVFVFSLSVLMAMTDVSPIFKVFGFDINASPVALGLSIGAMLIAGMSSKTVVTTKAAKAKKIRSKANEIVAASSEIVEEEKHPGE